jgi:hypothetical protein
MKLGVFISWSGERSKLLALQICWWLPRVLSPARPWMSEKDIHKGERWSSQIGNQLEGHRVGIICTTPENMESPWLLFEAGALSKSVGDAKVCPLLLGIRASDLVGPLSLFQATAFERAEMFSLISSLNSELGDDRVEEQILRDSFDKFWPELEERVRIISQTPLSAQSVPLVLRAFAKHGLPEPEVGSIAHFSSGYESHAIYDTVCTVAQRRLWVFGRKNRKLFDKDHADFLATLQHRISSQFDFRCLFLDPRSPSYVLSSAHEDANFPEQLRASIRNAIDALTKAGVNPDQHCRTYSIQRSVTSITADDAVLYSRIHRSADGKATKLTKCAFTVVNFCASEGTEITKEFLDLWEAGAPITSVFR